MADNVTITSGANSTPPAGTVVSTDEAASGHVQRVKLTLSADGSDTHLQADADGLLVNLGTNNDVTVTSGTITLAASTNNIGDVDVLTVPAPLSTTGGGTEATALRVTLASDSTGLVSVDDNGGSLTVDGTIAATQSGTWTVQPGNTANTTAWLVTGTGGTFPVTDSGGSLTVDNATLAVVGGGTEAAALRVTLATDSTGLVSVDDNGGSLTIDGTVTANLAAGTNNIGDVDVLSVPAPLSTTGGGTEATALRVTLANDSTGLVSVDDNGSSLTIDNSTLSVVGGGTQATALRVTIASDSTGTVAATQSGGWAVSVTGSVDTEMPAAQSVVAGITPSASPSVISWPYVYDGGTQWNRTRQADTGITNEGLVGAGLIAHLDDTATGTLSENQYGVVRMSSRRALLVEGVASGTAQNVTVDRASASAVTSVSGSATSVQLLAANTSAKGRSIYNDSTAVMYVKLGTTASATDFSAKLADNSSGVGGYYEPPAGYTGRIDAIWASATGAARITELT